MAYCIFLMIASFSVLAFVMWSIKRRNLIAMYIGQVLSVTLFALAMVELLK